MALDPLNYKHPKYCFVKGDKSNLYKVIGYHWTIRQYKIQNMKTFAIKLISPESIEGVWSRDNVEKIKKVYEQG